jgi:hypothetical protein
MADPRLKRAGVAGLINLTHTQHPKKSHIVVAKEGSQVKTIRFGEQGAKLLASQSLVKAKE